jgi:hypothetical protein
MPLLQSLFQAISDRQTGQISPLKLAQVIGTVAGSVGSVSDPSLHPIMRILGPWALGIAQHVPGKWLLPTNVSPSCAHETGPGRICGSFAVGGCHSCGRPVCLTHALVGFDAALACWACVKGGAVNAKPWRPPHAAAPSSPGDGIGWAYELLGLEPTCTAEEAKRAYKQKVAHFHPDHLGAGADSKANGDLLRSLKSAYDQIIKVKGAPP